jgi:hypothetical protein
VNLSLEALVVGSMKLKAAGTDALQGAGLEDRGYLAGTAEATASFVFTISSLRPLIREGRCLSAITLFDKGMFSVGIRLDISNPLSAFVELTHKTRDDREGDRIITDRIQLTWTAPTYGGRRWWFRCPRTYRKTTKLYLPNGGMALLEPPSLWPRICLPARRAVRSPPAKSRKAEPPAWRRRMGQLGHASDKAEMDALANLRAEIRALGASSREGRRGVHDTRRASVEVDVGSSVLPQRSASRLFGQAWAGR